eukprot:SAG11_NODE_1463_length_4863_cov_15.348657_5_plen_51_part_00
MKELVLEYETRPVSVKGKNPIIIMQLLIITPSATRSYGTGDDVRHTYNNR